MNNDRQTQIEEVGIELEKHKAALLKIRKVIPLVLMVVLFWTVITPVYRADNKIVSIIGVLAILAFILTFVVGYYKLSVKIEKLKDRLSKEIN